MLVKDDKIIDCFSFYYSFIKVYYEEDVVIAQLK